MWDFLIGYLFGRATGISRVLRPVLLLLTVVLIVAAVAYAAIVFTAVTERNQAPHVKHHTTP